MPKNTPTDNADIPRKRRKGAEERQEEIVQVAIELAAKSGVDAVTTQDMANAMGLTQGAIFRHFPTKDEIWLAAIRWIRIGLLSVVETAAARSENPLEALENIFFAHLSFISRHPGFPRIVFSDQLLRRDTRLKQLIQEVITGYEGKIAAILTQAKATGFARPDLDESSAATLFIGMIQGLVLQWNLFGSQRALPEAAKKVFPIYLDGIRSRNNEEQV
ncbi:TetR family transcriptional regulator [Sulfuricella sp. T08]|uniref:TetR/AcrR family transcriptional regulator n=1 Tax=Sulfuricella sp. T08 TaxID=1632857 RepID=UPI0006179A60|nr:TetR/AcrR family transcriptional regulator [Sulfuricella sp. T08]GAO36252.1 TetR family transcriptional regulator [Sulfuricella sp. T08]